jgi:uncharacterized RDD family membrane protein YckC
MAHDVLPPDAGPWRREPGPTASGSSGGPWGYNPYTPPRDPMVQRPRARPLVISELRLATPGQRLLAKTIDLGLLGLALAPGSVVVLCWDTRVGTVLLLLGLLAIAVFQWAIIATSGQTLGKRWTGLRVITEKGDRVGFFRGVFLRVWIMSVGSLLSGGVAWLLDPFFVFGKQHRTLHDYLAGTLVIVAETPGDPYL